ncbi:MAG: ATPase component NikO of energizing module of nickel transporter [Chloroflexi bacterium]|nr:ATPase component NikO of energizing module of nickel transporter [Chloroflexota bacterium]
MSNLLIDTETIFSLDRISFDYEGKHPALDRISLEIIPGESLVILGANGSGKSSLLKILDGLYFPTKGEVCAFGVSLTEAAFKDEAFNFDFRRRVGLVFQDPDVQLFSPSVLDEVAFAPLQMGLERDEVNERVEEALQALRIEKLRDRAPHRLSGGEKRRVALASVFSLKPEVWLLDEPSAGLDPRSQSWLVEFILQLHDEGKTVITATHDLEIAEQIATRVVIFDEEHHLVAAGDPDTILCDHDLLHRCNLAHYHLRQKKL